MPQSQQLFCDIVISSDNLKGKRLSCLLIWRCHNISFRKRNRTSGSNLHNKFLSLLLDLIAKYWRATKIYYNLHGFRGFCWTCVGVRMKGRHTTYLVRFYIFIWSFADNDTKQLVTNLQCTTALQALGNNTLQTQFDCLISLLTTLINTKLNKSSPVRSDTKD